MKPTNISNELALAKKAALSSGKLLLDKKKDLNEKIYLDSKDIKLKADIESKL